MQQAIWTPTRKARALAIALIATWENWGNFAKEAPGGRANLEDMADDALEHLSEDIRMIDLHQVDGALAAPLNYWVRARLDDDNPEDLTYDEMIQSIRISLEVR